MALTGAEKMRVVRARRKAENQKLVSTFLGPAELQFLDSFGGELGLKSRSEALKYLVEASAGSASSSKFTIGRPRHTHKKQAEPA